MSEIKRYNYWNQLNTGMVCFLLFCVVFFSIGLIMRWNRHNEIGYWLVLATVLSYIFCIGIELLSAKTTLNILNTNR